jgi:PAS domain S-box-containing protein
MFDAAGAFKGYCGVGRNITERRRAEEAQGRLAAIVEHSEDAIISRDMERRIVTWNTAAERLFGYAAAEVVGRQADFLIPPDQQAQAAGMRALLAEGKHAPPYDTVRLAKDGRRVEVSLTQSAIRDASGQMIGVSLTIRDISERKHMEQQLRQSQKMEAVGQLTGGVAHDFNNLLGVILGNLDLLERAVADNAPALKRVATAQKAAERGADLTQRLLAFSRRQALNAEPVALAGCVANVIEMARRTIGPDIEIKTAIAAELPAVQADAAGLESVLLNLMINSRDAMPNGGAITVTARLTALDEEYPGVKAGELRAERYMCITLGDTGKGMPPEVLERVFEPFFTTKERGKGTGLGLAMVYGFAKQSSGHVNIYSELGHGTTVRLYLPLAEAGAGVPEALSAETSPERIEATALVVDDEADLLEVAVAYLEELGFRVLQASNGPAALEVLERESGIDLLLTDIMMPGGMNGVELARRVRAARPGIRVLYSTGFSSVMMSEKMGQKLGTDADSPVLSKPYRRAEFFTAVRKAMANPTGDATKGAHD